MSVPILSVINEVAAAMGDPGFSQITVPEYLSWANQRSRLLATKMNLVKWVAYADIKQDEELYAEPDDCIQLTRLQFSPTPTDPRSFRDLHPYFFDEFRSRTNWNYPTGDPDSYFADQGFIYLVGRPVAALAKALRMEYWGLPVEMQDPYADTIPFSDVMRDFLREGIEVSALWKLEKRQESQAAEARWHAAIGDMRPKLEIRSSDRRSSVRVSRTRGGLGRSV